MAKKTTPKQYERAAEKARKKQKATGTRRGKSIATLRQKVSVDDIFSNPKGWMR